MLVLQRNIGEEIVIRVRPDEILAQAKAAKAAGQDLEVGRITPLAKKRIGLAGIARYVRKELITSAQEG